MEMNIAPLMLVEIVLVKQQHLNESIKVYLVNWHQLKLDTLINLYKDYLMIQLMDRFIQNLKQ